MKPTTADQSIDCVTVRTQCI